MALKIARHLTLQHRRSTQVNRPDLTQIKVDRAKLIIIAQSRSREAVMEISLRDLLTVLHGMGFGALFMLAFAGAAAELYLMSAPAAAMVPSVREQRLLWWYLLAMVVLAW